MAVHAAQEIMLLPSSDFVWQHEISKDISENKGPDFRQAAVGLSVRGSSLLSRLACSAWFSWQRKKLSQKLWNELLIEKNKIFINFDS
jgi:hypothetical protein